MERIYNKTVLAGLAKEARLETIFDTDVVHYFASRYRKGEYLCEPCEEEEYLQIIVRGMVGIYHIRDDGSKYSLAQGEGLYLLGDIEFDKPSPSMFFAEALTDTVSIVISLKQYRSVLQNDIRFLRFLTGSLSEKLSHAAQLDIHGVSLKERVRNHMKYHCEGQRLSGLEKTAAQLNCSSRQLQRVLNKLEEQQVVQKCGKGEYALL